MHLFEKHRRWGAPTVSQGTRRHPYWGCNHGCICPWWLLKTLKPWLGVQVAGSSKMHNLVSYLLVWWVMLRMCVSTVCKLCLQHILERIDEFRLHFNGWICQWWLLKTLKTWLGGRVRSRVFTQKDEFLGAAVKIMHLFEKYQRWGAPAILQWMQRPHILDTMTGWICQWWLLKTITWLGVGWPGHGT